MFATFRNALGRYRGAILGWGLALSLLGMYLMSFYETLAAQRESLEQLISSYPPEMLAFFGDASAMFTPEGYLTIEYFSYMPIILGIFAVLAGSGMLAGDEESGTLDLYLAHPISRTALFMARLLAFLAATISILGIMWLGMAVGSRTSAIDVPANQLARPFLSLLGVLLFFGALALLLSLVLPSRRAAGMASGLVLVASFFVTALARISEELETLARFSPLNYYQSGGAISGLNGSWLAGLLIGAALFTLLAWWRFERRDIRVAGEGSWQGFALRRKPVSPG